MTKKYKKIELRELKNLDCIKKCNKEIREQITENNICNEVLSVLDGKKVRCVGEWAVDKINTLTKYFGIFSTSMKNKWTGGLNYIEVASGPGRCVVRENGTEIDGTALSIVNNDALNYIKQAIFIDNNRQAVRLLNDRINDLGKNNIANAIIGDYSSSEEIGRIIGSLSKSSLNLAFIDPTDLSIPYSTVRTIGETLNKVDLIITVALGTDLTRNIKSAILDDSYQRVKQKYINFLGDDEFFTRVDIKKFAEQSSDVKLRQEFLNEYKKNLRKIGYNYFDTIKIKHYYNLLFASKDKTGLKFWKEISKIDSKGQRHFFDKLFGNL